jgi:Predicted integral membrane protein (DUF2269)
MHRQALLQAHWLGALLLGLALVYGTWAWQRVRRHERMAQDPAPPLRRLRAVYLCSAVPGSLLLLASGTLLITTHHGWAWAWTQPWMLAMLGITLLEFTEGITVTRTHIRRALAGAPSKGDLAPHLDLPLYAAALWLGVTRPLGWWPVLGAIALALAAAALMWQGARRGSF